MIRALFPRKGAHADALKALAEINPPKSAFSDLAPEILAGDIRTIMAMEEKRAQQLAEFNDEG